MGLLDDAVPPSDDQWGGALADLYRKVTGAPEPVIPPDPVPFKYGHNPAGTERTNETWMNPQGDKGSFDPVVGKGGWPYTESGKAAAIDSGMTWAGAASDGGVGPLVGSVKGVGRGPAGASACRAAGACQPAGGGGTAGVRQLPR